MACLSFANHVLAVLLALYGLLPLDVGAFDFDVGGNDGWVVPSAKEPGVYNQWASKNRFQVGDTIHFKYEKDSVMVVSEEDYNKCRSTHPIFFSNNGATEVTLDRPGLFYFISGVTGHCERGQRMIVKVMSHADDGPGGAPPAPPAQPQPSAAVPVVVRARTLAVAAAHAVGLLVLV